MDMNKLTNIAFAISGILIVFSVMTFGITMVNNIRNNMRYYAILITNGYTYVDIAKIILAAPLLVEAAALVSGFIVLLIVGDKAYLSLLLIGTLFAALIALMIFSVISAIALREFKRHDIANYLRRK